MVKEEPMRGIKIQQLINQEKGEGVLSKKFTLPNYSSGSQQFDSAE